jgi:hypothetical protein
MKQQQENKVVVLPPPLLFENKLSNKYDLILNLKWGKFEKEIKVSREQGRFTYELLKGINQALLEGSESYL